MRACHSAGNSPQAGGQTSVSWAGTEAVRSGVATSTAGLSFAAAGGDGELVTAGVELVCGSGVKRWRARRLGIRCPAATVRQRGPRNEPSAGVIKHVVRASRPSSSIDRRMACLLQRPVLDPNASTEPKVRENLITFRADSKPRRTCALGSNVPCSNERCVATATRQPPVFRFFHAICLAPLAHSAPPLQTIPDRSALGVTRGLRHAVRTPAW